LPSRFFSDWTTSNPKLKPAVSWWLSKKKFEPTVFIKEAFLRFTFFGQTIFRVSAFRNHEEVKYPYGYYIKKCFQLCGQVFER
jgi:hypothetical protein